jgi:hypothetical protein
MIQPREPGAQVKDFHETRREPVSAEWIEDYIGG